MQSLEHTTKTVGQGQRLPMNSLWPSTARTRARKCRMSVETARYALPAAGTRGDESDGRSCRSRPQVTRSARKEMKMEFANSIVRPQERGNR